MDNPDYDAPVYVAGHRGLVGSAITRALKAQGYTNLVTADRAEVDLRDAAATRALLHDMRPHQVYVAAATVGGIVANDTYPATFLYDNLMIATNVIHAAYEAGAAKLLFLGSTCIYPKLAPQPLREDALLTGPLEPTNEWYAIAKIAGIKLCQAYRKQYGVNYIAAMPTNLYGSGDNFDLQTSHVLPALIRKCHEAKCSGAADVTIWGTGAPRREFCHADDCARACIYLMAHYDEPEIINIGVGEDIAIRELAEMVADVVGFRGQLRFDTDKPDGTPRKLVDVERLFALGWRPEIGLREGIAQTYAWFQQNQVLERALG